MFGQDFQLFRIFDIDIKINPGWAVIATLLAWSLAQGVFPNLYEGLETSTYWGMALLGVLGLGFSIIMHELAHSVVARSLGTRVSSITLFMFGGIAVMETEPKSPGREVLIALAGPVMSLCIGLAFLALATSLGGGAIRPASAGVMHYLGLLNTMLAVFNLIPAFPMDGGRALRAALWAATGDFRRATRQASNIGKAFGTVLMALGGVSIVFGNLIGGIWWILIGGFLRAAAGASYINLKVEAALEGLAVERFMTADVQTVPPGLTVECFVEDHLYRYGHDLFPVVENGRALGTVGLKEIKSVPRKDWPRLTVSQVLSPLSAEQTTQPGEAALDALSKMRKAAVSRLLVIDDGRFVAVLALKDLMDLISLKLALEPEEAAPAKDLSTGAKHSSGYRRG